MKGDRLNDHERELWVMNDEGLYLRWQASKLSKRAFIQQRRAEIDAVIRSEDRLPV